MNKPVIARVARSVCPHDCPSTCALDVEIIDERTIGRVHGAKDDPYTAGVICEKVARYAERIHHPERLTHPMRRIGAKGEGRWQRISWDEAFDEIIERWEAIEAEFGPEAIWPYYYAGTMGHVHRDGLNRLRHARGYSEQYDTICTGAAWPGYLAGTGLLAGPNPELMAEADCVVIWGTNAVNTQVNVMTHAMRARKQRGAKIVAVDIYMNGTMEQADLPILLRPGSDGAFALGVMHVLLRDGLADRAYLARMTDFDGAVEAHIMSRTPQWASDISGVPVATIEAFARLVGTTPNTYFRLGYGFTRQRNGSTNMHAALCIPAVTGAWQHRAGGAFHSNSGAWHLDKSLIHGDAMGPSNGRMLDMSEIGKVLTGDPAALKGTTPVKAIFIQNTNPVNVAPEQELVRRGFAREDLFTVVHEQFMTDTAQMADIVLPATMFLEHNDYYRRGGHTRLLVGPRLVEAPGECRSNFDVVNELLRRLGAEDESLHLSDRQMVAETLRRSGYGELDEIEKTGFVEMGVTPEAARFANGFGFDDGRFRFRPAWGEIAARKGFLWTIEPERMPAMVDYWDINEKATDETPLRLATSPSRGFLNSSFAETPGSQRRQPGPSLLIRTDDAVRCGVVNGTAVRVGNARGEVELRAQIFEGLPPGVVIAEGIHPNRAHREGRGINTLIGSDQVPPFGGVAFHDATVWVRPASA
jgi:anaerobic selenocysteine-containing dehydrogenase